MRNGCVLVGIVVALLPAAALAQAARPEFDAASIKENRSGQGGGTLRRMPDGGIQTQNIPARTLINVAFGLKPYQVVNAPGWAREVGYDIQAKPAEAVARDQMPVMLQSLLVDRFGLVFHRERRQLDGFALVRARPDRLGPDMRPSQFDCEKQMDSEPRCRTGGITSEGMVAVGAPIWNLLQEAIGVTGAPVADETGLTGTHDFELRWAREPDAASDRPSFFTALQEQLGLRLERRRVEDDVFVVDRLERPTPD
jgi:uncharacterized protein (TIGR03435 family)